MRDFHDITGADVIHAYGATETTPLVAVNRGLKPSLRGVISDEEKWDLKRKQGLPVNGIDIRIVDAEGNDLPHDGTSQGEVLLRGPCIIERDHKIDDDPQKFPSRYLRSADVGTIDPKGYFKN